MQLNLVATKTVAVVEVEMATVAVSRVEINVAASNDATGNANGSSGVPDYWGRQTTTIVVKII